MGAINCKTYDTGEIVAEIRENRRYAIASPSTVTGTPSLAMQSAEQMAVVYIYINDVKLSTPLTISGTTKTPIMINGASPSREDLPTLSFEVTGIGSGEVLLTTDEPNGSPASPFATVDQRTAWATANLATLRSGVSTVWGPGAVEYVWNGPLATDWQGIRGPYPGSPSNPFASMAELLAANPATWELPWVANPLAPCGKTQARWAAGLGAWVPRPSQCIAKYVGVNGAPLLDTTGDGRTLATWIGVWTGAPLADWLLPNYEEIEISGTAEMLDSGVSTATQKLRLALRSAYLLTGNEWDGMLGFGGAAAANSRGLGGVKVSSRRFSGLFRGVVGNGAASTASAGQQVTTGSFSAGVTAPFFEAYFGATTNILKLHTVSIWSA